MAIKDDAKVIGNIFRSLNETDRAVLAGMISALEPAKRILDALPAPHADALKAAVMALGTALLFKGPEKVITALIDELKS